MPSGLVSLTYVSTCALGEESDLDADVMLREIAVIARTRNEACELTGYLVFENGFFLQTIEGDAAEVERLFASIARDPRHSDAVVLHRAPITERTFPAWGMSASVRRGGRREVAPVVEYIKGRARAAPATPPAEYFRDLLAPSRQIVAADRATQATAAPIRLALCSNSAFWLMPTFNHIALRYGETPQSSRIANPETPAIDPVPLEYVDIHAYGSRTTRVIGVNDGLLTSYAAAPMLSNLDLVVLLARVRENEDYLAFVGHLLSHTWGGVRTPALMLISPDATAEFVPAIQAAAEMQGYNLQMLTGAPKNGDEVWAHIRTWLLGQ